MCKEKISPDDSKAAWCFYTGCSENGTSGDILEPA